MKKSVLIFTFATMFGFATFTSVGQTPVRQTETQQQQDQRQIDQQRQQDQQHQQDQQRQQDPQKQQDLQKHKDQHKQMEGMKQDGQYDRSTEISVSELPQAVQKAAKDNNSSATIESAERKVLPTGETVYKVKYQSDNAMTGKEETKMFYANGREYKEDKTEKIQVSELPQAVQNAAKENNRTAKIESAEKKVLPTGETVYKVNFDSSNALTGEEDSKMFYANGSEYEEEDVEVEIDTEDGIR